MSEKSKKKKPAASKAAGKNKPIKVKPGKSAKPAKLVKSVKPTKPAAKKGENIGKVYRGVTKYIDSEPKAERNYVVVDDDGRRVAVSKLKSIKKFDKNGRNADKALVEINSARYGLEKRTGVDFQVFGKNRMSGKPLTIQDKDVFPEGKERFKLGSHDLSRTLRHTGKAGNKKRRDK